MGCNAAVLKPFLSLACYLRGVHTWQRGLVLVLRVHNTFAGRLMWCSVHLVSARLGCCTLPCIDAADMRSDVQAIFKETPHDKQVMMFSATMSKEIRTVCKKFMNKVRPWAEQAQHACYAASPDSPPAAAAAVAMAHRQRGWQAQQRQHQQQQCPTSCRWSLAASCALVAG
jgi:hypothetical protein